MLQKASVGIEIVDMCKVSAGTEAANDVDGFSRH